METCPASIKVAGFAVGVGVPIVHGACDCNTLDLKMNCAGFLTNNLPEAQAEFARRAELLRLGEPARD